MGIYCIWSKTHETYIGQSIDIGRRIYQHYEALESGVHPNERLQSDWSLGHARFRFDVVEIIASRSDLDIRELFYISKYQTYRYGYNSTPDGQGRSSCAGEKTSGEDASVEATSAHSQTITQGETTSFQGNTLSDVAENDPADSMRDLHFRDNRCRFVELFDGRYMAENFQRKHEAKIVRIWFIDEVWCYLTDSEYHAEQVARWFSGFRLLEGSAFDWCVKHTSDSGCDQK